MMGMVMIRENHKFPDLLLLLPPSYEKIPSINHTIMNSHSKIKTSSKKGKRHTSIYKEPNQKINFSLTRSLELAIAVAILSD